MVASIVTVPRFFWRDPSDDTPLAGGKVYFYLAGTTTPRDTWADYDQSSTNTNPVVLDADGGAVIYGAGAYRIIVRRSDDTLVAEVDDFVVGRSSADEATINGGEVIHTTDHMIDIDDNGLVLIANRPTAITFNIDSAIALGPNFAVTIKNIGAGTLTLDPSLTDLIDGAATLAVLQGASLVLIGNGTGFRSVFLYDFAPSIAAAVAALRAEILGDTWALQPIGVPIPLQDNITGVSAPPTDQDYRYILLTAGEDGVGEYNEGILISESVSGSAPLVVATAVVDDADSPIDGQTVRLINTERRFLRAGSAGTLQDSQNLAHSHNQGYLASFGVAASAGPLLGGDQVNTGSSGGDEARPRNVGVTYYMRIK